MKLSFKGIQIDYLKHAAMNSGYDTSNPDRLTDFVVGLCKGQIDMDLAKLGMAPLRPAASEEKPA